MPMSLPKPKECAECGDGAIFHKVTYISIVVDEIMAPFSQPNPFLRGFVRLVYGIERKVTPKILNGLMQLGWATKVSEPDNDTQLLALMLWNEAKERGIEVAEFRLFGLPRNIFVATYPDGLEIAYEGIPMPGNSDLERVPWMDNKAVLKQKFRKLGLPVAKGGAVSNLKDAKKLFATLTPPVIAKPFSGSASRHTVLHITNEEELTRGFNVAKEIAPKVVIEEELV
ncbi:MAG: hypothetical protein Q8S35_03010, partial [bacterium]|nr:hypothetical protein [bacterium]